MTTISKPSARWPALAILQMEGINALSQYWRTFTLYNPCQSSDVYNERYKKSEPPCWAALVSARARVPVCPTGYCSLTIRSRLDKTRIRPRELFIVGKPRKLVWIIHKAADLSNNVSGAAGLLQSR